MGNTNLTLKDSPLQSPNPKPSQEQNFRFVSGKDFSNWEFLPPKQSEHKPSKQLNYYYRHKQERLSYQQAYYNKHKNMILSNKRHYDYILKVKRTENNNRLLRLMSKYSNSVLKKEPLEKYLDAYNHHHGRPNLKKLNSRYCLQPKIMLFHAIPSLAIIDSMIDRDVKVIYKDGKTPKMYNDAITARQLTIQQAHFLGLKLGDSIMWNEKNRYTGKIETHTVCFDRSGLDNSHETNLPSLVECAIETGRKGLDLLSAFEVLHSINGYIQVWRGNKLLLTSEILKPSVYRDYLKSMAQAF